LGLGPDGGFSVTWVEGAQIMGRRYDGAGAPQGQVFAVGPLAFGPEWASETILLASDNTTTVAWGERYVNPANGDVSSRVKVQRFDAGGFPLGSAISVAFGYLPLGGPGWEYRLGRTADDGSGGFIVVYDDIYWFDAIYYRVRVSRFQADGVPVFTGETVFAGGYLYAERSGAGVTARSSDDFLVLWCDQEIDLAARRYPAGTPPAELPFTVSDRAIAFYGTRADVAYSDSSADFVAAWVNRYTLDGVWLRWFGYRPVIFEDDFEGGNLSAWSLAVP